MADFKKLYADVIFHGKDAEEQARFLLEDKAIEQSGNDQSQQYLSLFDRNVRRQVRLQQQQQQPPPPAPAGTLNPLPFLLPIMLGWSMKQTSVLCSPLQILLLPAAELCR